MPKVYGCRQDNVAKRMDVIGAVRSRGTDGAPTLVAVELTSIQRRFKMN